MFGCWKVLGKEKIYIRQNKFLMLGYYKKKYCKSVVWKILGKNTIKKKNSPKGEESLGKVHFSIFWLSFTFIGNQTREKSSKFSFSFSFL